MLQLSSGRDQISTGTTWGVSGDLKHPVPASLQLSASIFSFPPTSAFHYSLQCCPVLQLPLRMWEKHWTGFGFLPCCCQCQQGLVCEHGDTSASVWAIDLLIRKRIISKDAGHDFPFAPFPSERGASQKNTWDVEDTKLQKGQRDMEPLTGLLLHGWEVNLNSSDPWWPRAGMEKENRVVCVMSGLCVQHRASAKKNKKQNKQNNPPTTNKQTKNLPTTTKKPTQNQPKKNPKTPQNQPKFCSVVWKLEFLAPPRIAQLHVLNSCLIIACRNLLPFLSPFFF